MNVSWSAILLELAVVLLGLGILVLDLWTPVEKKSRLGLVAMGGLGLILLFSFMGGPAPEGSAFAGMIINDGLSLFFKRLFLVAGLVVAVLSADYATQIRSGIAEYHALQLLALAGMMLAASANDLAMMFVALELITVTFYVLTSFQRSKTNSLEAGVKYLILGALASGFLVFGIALVFGTANTTGFQDLAIKAPGLIENKLFLLGLLLVLSGFCFKIAAFPFQMWAPDVYQGAPVPTTAFLAIGSKAAGFVLLVRWMFTVIPDVALRWEKLVMILAGATILYGSLCAIPQRNLKRLLGYSSIANAGYLLLGVAAMTKAGSSAVLFYLGGYLFTVLGVFAVLTALARQSESEDITALAGLSRRSPFLAGALTLCIVSLAGIPPLAGFTGKFLLIKAALEQGVSYSAYYGLVAVALFGVVVSLYYYFGVIRAVYWSSDVQDLSPVEVAWPLKICVAVCAAGVVLLGLMPGSLLAAAETAVKAFR